MNPLSRLRGLVTRFYLARLRRPGFGMLPATTTFPLRRDGLDPAPELAAVRRSRPVSRLPLPFGPPVWLVTGYEQVKAVLGDAESFSNDFLHLARAGIATGRNPGGLGFADPPDHTRLRRLLAPEFTVRRLERLAPRVQAIVDARLDHMAAAEGPVDLVQEFALPIPSLLICELLGIPYADRADFQRLSVARFDVLGGAGAAFGAVSESMVHMRRFVRQQRVHPGEGLIADLIRRHGDDVDDEDLAGLADGLLTGGFETTASMLALGSLLLIRDAPLRARVAVDPDAVHRCVEELLRYLTVVQLAFPRFARVGVKVGGVRIAVGDIVLCSLSGADRDDALTADAAVFDPDREPTQHLAFGYGMHRCLGAELARIELRTAFPALARRFPRMRLAVSADELRYRRLSLVHGIQSLPVLVNGSR